MSDERLPPAETMHGLLAAYQMCQALFAIAELDVTTALLGGPMEIDDLATEVGADANTLGRIIRYLAQYGVFRTSGGSVEVTDVGRTLVGGWVNENPDLAVLQNDAIAGFTQNARGDLLDVFEFPPGQMVADIGGADGTLMVELLAGRPERRGIVFDLPSMVSAARSTLLAAGLEERVAVVAGDFFEQVPAADVYVMSAVLQDWNNALSLRILRNVARAALPGARLVVIDIVVPEGHAAHLTKTADVTMMGMLGGRQRGETEWRRLLADGGFTLQRVVPGSGSYSALEATLA